MRLSVPGLAFLLPLAGCTALPVPGRDTPYFLDQGRVAHAAAPAAPGEEGAALREAASKLKPLAESDAARIAAHDETEGLLDLGAPGAADFVASVADRAKGDLAIGSATLDLEKALLAAYARNPDVEAARATWRSTTRMYDQATYLEDVILRTRAFATTASPRVAAGPMSEPLFPYPGAVALKGEMIDREVAMAREATRMRLRDVLAETAMAYLEAAHAEEEVRVRDEEIALAERMVAAARASVAAGRAAQAEILEMEAELAMATNQRAQALATGVKAKGTLNTRLARDPAAPLSVSKVGDPPRETPPVEGLLALAARYAPEPRMKRAEAERTAAAIRMGEAMVFVPPAPGAVGGAMPGMPGAMGVAPKPSAPSAAGAASGMGGGDGMGAAAGPGRAMPAPAAAPPPSPALTPPATAPLALGSDLAWLAELRERRVALEREAEEAARAAARAVVAAHLDMDAARRMFVLAAQSEVPLARQAADERVRLYEGGRGEFAEVVGAYRRFLEARNDELSARYEYGEAEAKAWMAVGARPSVAAPATGGGR